MTYTQVPPVPTAYAIALIPAKLAKLADELNDKVPQESTRDELFLKPMRLSHGFASSRAGDTRTWLADPLNWHRGIAIDREFPFGGAPGGAL